MKVAFRGTQRRSGISHVNGKPIWQLPMPLPTQNTCMWCDPVTNPSGTSSGSGAGRSSVPGSFALNVNPELVAFLAEDVADTSVREHDVVEVRLHRARQRATGSWCDGNSDASSCIVSHDIPYIHWNPRSRRAHRCGGADCPRWTALVAGDTAGAFVG